MAIKFPTDAAVRFAAEWLSEGHEPPQPELRWVADWLLQELARRNQEKVLRSVAKEEGIPVKRLRALMKQHKG